MRKRLLTQTQERKPTDSDWFDVEHAAIVEVTSEEKDSPVEAALVLNETNGWRAGHPGAQVIRLVFNEPKMLKYICLNFEETESTRTQEFVLRSSSDGGRNFQEIVRQQWNFSPPATTVEREEYRIELSNVNVLELVIVPDISGGSARASLRSLRIA
jgi:hypothetical protein